MIQYVKILDVSHLSIRGKIIKPWMISVAQNKIFHVVDDIPVSFNISSAVVMLAPSADSAMIVPLLSVINDGVFKDLGRRRYKETESSLFVLVLDLIICVCVCVCVWRGCFRLLLWMAVFVVSVL